MVGFDDIAKLRTLRAKPSGDEIDEGIAMLMLECLSYGGD